MLAMDGPPRLQIVADRRGRDTGLVHEIANLVEADHHIASGEEPGDRGALMAIDLDTAVRGDRCVEGFSEIGMY
jgi:hypothetical protein